jgi:hypothetical protein
MVNEDQLHEQEVRETKGTLLDLLIAEGPLVALAGAVLAAPRLGLRKRRRGRRA